MKLFPAYSILWSSFLVCWSSQSEMKANDSDVCQGEKMIDALHRTSGHMHTVEEDVLNDNFLYLCRLYPTNILNCSWSFHTLQNNTQLFVLISICDNKLTVDSSNPLDPEEKVGSRSLILRKIDSLYVILQFNITLPDKWTVYTNTYNFAMLEVLSPPQNISASFKDGDLLVTWGLPQSREVKNPFCFGYQLDMGDQEGPRNFSKQLSYTLSNADPSSTYRVRIRTRQIDMCQYNSQWSEWSPTITVQQQQQLNTLVIISASLGIPMILLAVLLLIFYQRVSKVLFPPIPCPPPKYIYFLEKNDTFNLFYPASTTEPVEEITEVEDTEQDTVTIQHQY